MEAAILPTAAELSLVVAVAVSMAVLGFWLTRTVSMSFGWVRTALFGDAAPRRSPGNDPFLANARPLAVVREQMAEIIRTAIGAAEAAVGSIRYSIRALLVRPAATVAKSSSNAHAQPRRGVVAGEVAAHLTAEMQWERAAATVSRAILGTNSVRKVHAAAAEKLDVASYAMEQLLAELDGVMKRKPALGEVARLTVVKGSRSNIAVAARVAA